LDAEVMGVTVPGAQYGPGPLPGSGGRAANSSP
jgi:hypothetical protein